MLHVSYFQHARCTFTIVRGLQSRQLRNAKPVRFSVGCQVVDKLAQGSSVTALLKDGTRSSLKGVLEVEPVEKTGQVGLVAGSNDCICTVTACWKVQGVALV